MLEARYATQTIIQREQSGNFDRFVGRWALIKMIVQIVQTNGRCDSLRNERHLDQYFASEIKTNENDC